MSSWFSKKRKENKNLTQQQKTDQINKAIQDLRSHQTLLAKKSVHLQKQIVKYNNEARACMKRKNKKGALIKIRLRKQVEKRIENLDNQSFNLETQITALDETLLNQSIMKAMKNSSNAMTQAMAGMDIDDVDQIQEDIIEAIELNKEISEAISRPLNNDYDDDELLAELDDIMEEENEKILHSNMNMNVSNNNNGSKKNKKVVETKVVEEVFEYKEDLYAEEENSEEEAELRKLEVEMNMSVMSAVKESNELIFPQIPCR